MLNEVMLYLFIWMPLLLVLAVGVYVENQRHGNEESDSEVTMIEKFIGGIAPNDIKHQNIDSMDSMPKPTRFKDYIITDTDTRDAIWMNVLPKDIENAFVGVYGISDDPAGVVERIIRKGIENKRYNSFPDVSTLNDQSQFQWMSYKPRTVPGKLLEKIIEALMERTKLHSDHGYFLVRYRITHANVSAADDYLLTMKFIFHKEGALHAKVVESDVIARSNKNEGYDLSFRNGDVIGLIHEQHVV